MTAFASDNYAGVHPEVFAAISAADALGHVTSYGEDPVTEQATERIREHLGADAQAFFVWGGTAANVLSLESLAPQPQHAIVCASTAHINTDEGGAPERQLARKLIAVDTPDGKLTPELLAPRVSNVRDVHSVVPKVVSITQSTELGTLYEPEEIRAIADFVHERDLLLHLDGARIANAAVAQGLGLREATRDLGVDALSLGGTKNGALGCEAVVLWEDRFTEGFGWRRKQAMQLASKHRYLAAQMGALLTDDLWRRNAANANAMATRLAAAVRDIDSLTITQEAQANGIFVAVPPAVRDALWDEGFKFYVWDEQTHEVRWMCSWDTTEADVDAFAAAVRKHAS